MYVFCFKLGRQARKSLITSDSSDSMVIFTHIEETKFRISWHQWEEMSYGRRELYLADRKLLNCWVGHHHLLRPNKSWVKFNIHNFANISWFICTFTYIDTMLNMIPTPTDSTACWWTKNNYSIPICVRNLHDLSHTWLTSTTFWVTTWFVFLFFFWNLIIMVSCLFFMSSSISWTICNVWILLINFYLGNSIFLLVFFWWLQ